VEFQESPQGEGGEGEEGGGAAGKPQVFGSIFPAIAEDIKLEDRLLNMKVRLRSVKISNWRIDF
jgi:hypothetical protein